MAASPERRVDVVRSLWPQRTHWCPERAFNAHRREVLSKLRAESQALAALEQAERETRDLATYEAFKAAQPADTAAQSSAVFVYDDAPPLLARVDFRVRHHGARALGIGPIR